MGLKFYFATNIEIPDHRTYSNGNEPGGVKRSHHYETLSILYCINL